MSSEDPRQIFPNVSAEAEVTFSLFLRRVEAGEVADFEAFLNEKPSSLRRDLRELWSFYDAYDPFNDASLLESGQSVQLSDSSTLTGRFQEFMENLRASKTRASRYEDDGEIARGGMGSIHRVRDRELDRELAMKILRPRSRKPEAVAQSLARFLEEAQVTGQLDHPGIVPVHELGVDEKGRAFFTMRLVRGKDLKTVMTKAQKEEDGWNMPRILGVLQKACDAMAYAHSKGVTHRDLKPANIMVGRYGEVYVMDWGLAKVQGRKDRRNHGVARGEGDDSTEESVRSLRSAYPVDGEEPPVMTRDGSVLGTPWYMPPEQARGELDKMGPRCDVYAMGAILYEVLAGRMPYEEPGIWPAQQNVLEVVQEMPPESLDRIAPHSPAELQSICNKAMARDPADRYLDLEDLGADLRAYLEKRPVTAHATGAWVELRKWVSRNRALSIALFMVFLVATSSGFLVAYQARQRAEEVAAERDRAETMLEFQRAMLTDLDPHSMGVTLGDAIRESFHETLGSDGTPDDALEKAMARLDSILPRLRLTDAASHLLDREILAAASHKLDDSFSDDPETELYLRSSLVFVYQELGLMDRAVEQGRRIYELARSLYVAEDPRLQTATHTYAAALHTNSDQKAAEALFRESMEVLRRGGSSESLLLGGLRGLGSCLVNQGRMREALPLLREARALADSILNVEAHPSHARILIEILSPLGRGLSRLGIHEEALSCHREAVSLSLRHFGEKSLRSLTSRNALARTRLSVGQVEEASAEWEALLETQQGVLGHQHYSTQATLCGLAACYTQLDRAEEAEALYLEALENIRSSRGGDHKYSVVFLVEYGRALVAWGRNEEAEKVLKDALQRDRSPGTIYLGQRAEILRLRAGICLMQRHFAEAEDLLRESLQLYREGLGLEAHTTLGVLWDLGFACAEQGHLDDAEAVFLDYLEHEGDPLQRTQGESILRRIREVRARTDSETRGEK